MKKYKTSDIVLENILLLIPLLLYGIYKNGYLIYNKGLINIYMILKPLYLVGISFLIKIVFDLIRYKKIKIDYDLLCVILVALIMPYNINYLLYSIGLLILYFLSIILDKKIIFNKVCFIYLIIILLNFALNDFTFKSPLELSFTYNFSFLDYLLGRSIGGIASTSILFSLLAYIILINNYCYKKNIFFVINISYLVLALVYFIITGNNSILINSDLIFASVFVCTIPMYSPYKIKNQIIYSICIGILSFLITVLFDNILSIYIATFIISLFLNFKNK